MENDNPLDIKLDVSVYTVGDLLDLSDESVDMVAKLRIIDKGVVEGNLREVPLVRLPEVIERITMEINTDANPT